MAPRSSTLPGAQTESAREIRRSFFCDLCQKGYARSNELEAHENSYDHQHKKRLKDMKAMTRQAPMSSKRKTEKSDMISLNLQSETPSRSSTNAGSAIKTKPLGFGPSTGFTDALRKDTSSSAVDPAVSVSGSGSADAENSERTEERALMWDELDEVEDLVALDAGRPAGMQRVMDSNAAYLQYRQGAMVGDIWKRIAEMKGQSVG